MLTGKQQQNKPLISITDGKKIGEIKDLYLDGELKKLAAVLLGAEGILKRKFHVIDRAWLPVIGVDVWLVTGSDRIVELNELANADTLVLMNNLIGREIQTEGGTKIGTVDDVILNDNGDVVGFVLGRVYVQGPLAERKTIARAAITNVGGKDSPMTTILARAEESLVQQMKTDSQSVPTEEQGERVAA